MVFDELDKIANYLPSYKQETRMFIESVSLETPDGEYGIAGDKVFARIMSYKTKPEELCVIESHDRYVDIQSTIVGAEMIGIYKRTEMAIEIPYNEQSDVTFYKRKAPTNRIIVPEGYFAIIFPYEAHSPQMQTDGYVSVKKFVVKIDKEIFGL